YRPRGVALETIVNYINPLRRRAAAEEARDLGLAAPPRAFRIGTVRYTSTDRVHREHPTELVPVRIAPGDLLGRRTAVLGMTRTGKSTAIKRVVSVVKAVADEN